ncbi:MAG: crossover junction endodeoxyribonuclease RuvC [Chloroflexi bacterium]|nr:crossover junction endodeoxyribonuclease RuvC [Chloroflexota bacterium]MBI4504796.1 crossover junction endodeoxyribonuclease RuvC [Chloroflexota bacterium]
MLVLGVDPGTATTGYGLVHAFGERLAAVEFGVLRTAAGTPLPQRLLALHGALSDLLRRSRPDCVAVELLFLTRNARTAMAVGQARGVVLLACAEAGLPVAEYSPLAVKKAVGYGRGPKAQVQEMVRILLALDAPPRPDDAADALAVALCHCQAEAARRALAGSLARAVGGPSAAH